MHKSYRELFLNRRMLSVLLLGFASGLPLSLVGSTLQAWFTVSGVNLVAIGFLALVGQPYVYKFVWAPLMDRFVPPLLGRRRGWVFLMQVALLITIASMALFDPTTKPLLLGALALAVAFLSASQDIAIDAYRTDLLPAEERGLGSALFVTTYRMAVLVSGSMALIIAAEMGWRFTYLLMAVMMLIGMVAAWFGPEPEQKVAPPVSLVEAVVEPFKEFMSREGAWALLLLVVLYKFGDAFSLSLTTTFMIRGLGFSLIDVGAITKVVGLLATIIGALIGGTLMARLGLFRSLMLFGILQAVSNLTFMLLAMVGKSYPMMIAASSAEYLAGGMGTAAFLAFLMSLCNQRYTATQFALLSALSAVGRVFVGPLSGVLVEHLGWVQFYFWTFVLALPGLLLLWMLRQQMVFRSGVGEQVVS